MNYERKKINTKITDGLKWEVDCFPLDKVIATLQKYHDEYTAKNYTDLTFHVDVRSGYYDDYHVEVTIAGNLLEDDAQYNRRIRQEEKLREQEAKNKANRLEAERKLYERLKKKFEKAGQA